MARQSKNDKKDVIEMHCIHGSDGKLMQTSKKKVKVWKEYKEKMLSEEIDFKGESQSMEGIQREVVK